jgi:hypothetical protein
VAQSASHLLTLVPRSQIFLPRKWRSCSSEMSVQTRSIRHHIPEDSILHSHCCENPKSYKPNSVHWMLDF